MRVLLVDDHVLFRQGLIHLLDGLAEAPEFVEADDLPSALSQADGVDLVLLDLHLKGPGGTEALATVRTAIPAATIVVVSGDDDPALIRRCIELGAAGFIPKSSTRSVLIGALRLVLAGGVYLPPVVLERGRGATEADSVRARLNLSGRQLEVLRMMIRGKANKVIARELEVSESTVKQHISASLRALGVSNRTEAVYRAAELGLDFDSAAGAG